MEKISSHVLTSLDFAFGTVLILRHKKSKDPLDLPLTSQIIY